MSKEIKTRIHFDYTFDDINEDLVTPKKWEKILTHKREYGLYTDSTKPVAENPLQGVEYFVKNSRSQRDFIISAWTPRGVIVSKKCLDVLKEFSIPEHQIFKIFCKNQNNELLDYHLLVFSAAPFYSLNFSKSEIFIVEKNGYNFDPKTKFFYPKILNDDVTFKNADEYFEIEKKLRENEQFHVNKYFFDKSEVPFYDLFYMSGDNQRWYVSDDLKKMIKRKKLKGASFTDILLSIEWG